MAYALKNRWRDGTTHVLLDFVAKLAALVPPPRFNLVRYHFRAQVVPEGPDPAPARGAHPGCPAREPSEAPAAGGSDREGAARIAPRPGNYSWAELMRRVFLVDVLDCTECHSRMRILAGSNVTPGAVQYARDVIGRALLVLVAAGVLGTATVALEIPAEKDPWTSARTKEFTLFSNADERTTIRIAAQLEAFRSAFGRITSGMTLSSPLPTFVYVFRDSVSFEPYEARKTGSTGRKEAYFLRTRDANYIALNCGSGMPERAIFHEYVHCIVNNSFPGTSLWFDEGLAELYSTFISNASAVEVGRPVMMHATLLQSHELLPLEQLFAVDRNSDDYNEADRGRIFYAESWALVHWLLMGSAERRRAASRYILDIAGGKDATEAWDSAFGENREEVERQLAAYVRRGSYPFVSVSHETVDTGSDIRVEPLPSAQALYRLGDLLAHGPDEGLPRAEAHFRAANAGGSVPAAYAGLGHVALRSKRYEEANRYVSKAIELDPANAAAHRLAAALLLRPYLGQTRDPSPEGLAEIRRARDHLKRVLAIEPNHPEAYATYGATFLFERGGASDGIAALEAARRLLPGRSDVLFNLALLQIRAGNREKAAAVVDGPLDTLDPEAATEARESLLDLDLDEARGLISRGEVAAGLEILRRVQAHTKDPERREAITHKIAEIEAAITRSRLVAELDRAARLAGKGQFTQAAAIIRKIRPEIKDPDLAKSADRMLAELTKMSK